MAQNQAPEGVTTTKSLTKAASAVPEGYVRLINPVHAHLKSEDVGRIGQSIVPESLVDDLLDAGFELA